MRLPAEVSVVEVGPRDGFQMEPVFIPTPIKIEIINSLARTGIRKIEATSFVHPRVIPQMADSAQVLRGIERVPSVRYTALVPNLKGAQRAVESGVDGLRIVICASESYNRRNVGASIAATLQECELVLEHAAHNGVSAEVVIGLCFGCPLEGEVPPTKVAGLVDQLMDMGFQEIGIADSVGLANPVQVQALMCRLLDRRSSCAFSMHFHNTRGLGLANVLAALQVGVSIFDSSLGGLGGCPVLKGGTGNVPTEDLVNMLNEMGLNTGVDTCKVMECSARIGDVLGRALPSYILQAGTRTQLYARREA